MLTKPVLAVQLNATAAAFDDGLQWLLCQLRGAPGSQRWQPVSFVASNKSVLARVIAERGIMSLAEANLIVTALPASYPYAKKNRGPGGRG